MGGVLLALLGARPTGRRAGLDLRAEDAEVRLGLPDEDAAGGLAGVGAVEAESNAADQLRHIGLCEVGVGAARARRRAVDALFDAAHERITIENGGARVCLEHVSNRHVLSLFEWSGLFYTSLSRHAGLRRFTMQTTAGWMASRDPVGAPRRLSVSFIRSNGEQLIRELWPGPEQSLALILRLAQPDT
jgi:hypothetical protein